MLGEGAAELCLGRDVEPVRRLVHIKVTGVAGKRERDVRLFELTGRHPVHLLVRLVLEFRHDGQEFFMVIVRPELPGETGILFGGHVYGRHLVGKIVLPAEE